MGKDSRKAWKLNMIWRMSVVCGIFIITFASKKYIIYTTEIDMNGRDCLNHWHTLLGHSFKIC